MDSFLVVTTTADGRQANRMCDALEKAGVSVLLEEVEVRHKDRLPASGSLETRSLCHDRVPSPVRRRHKALITGWGTRRPPPSLPYRLPPA
jgi:hypothetical protein